MPYEEIQQGDPVAADTINSMQAKIKADIQSQVEAAKQEVIAEGVDKADEADTFGGKTPEEWVTYLDEKYASKEHGHEWCPKRYFLDMEVILRSADREEGKLQPAVLIHDMGCHPIVQVYELQDLLIDDAERNEPYRFCWSGPPHAVDPEALGFKTKSWDEREWGLRPADLIVELTRGLDEEERNALLSNFKDTHTLNVWLTTVERLLFEPGPAQYHFDRGDVYRTAWVTDREDMTVAELKEQGEWPPLFIYRPRLVNDGFFRGGGATLEDWVNIDVFHLNLNEVEIGPQTEEEMYLMVLLKA